MNPVFLVLLRLLFGGTLLLFIVALLASLRREREL